jgi:isochorismate synthase|tara:strand:+ start:27229 stop:28206 length:978 start_codon:yes stop_codon:yes gene_type:complete
MADVLTYRIPNKEKVHKVGFFTQARMPYEANGFFISNHNKSAIYKFDEAEGDQKADFFFSERPPYAVSKKEYLIGAESLLNSFPIFNLRKAVYGRVKSAQFDSSKCAELFDKLCEEYPNAFVYLASSPQFGTWIGASPEVLLSMHGKQGYTMSLAGTRRVNTVVEDWEDKEMEEQYLVSEYIQNRLLTQELQEIEQHGPFDMEAGPVKHLRTDFSFYSPNKSALEIALELHPTPAVAGVPTKVAQDLIATLEPFHRDLYTGFIGVVSEEHSYLYVNLRCCQIQEGKAFLYLGGGYTSQSIPEDEWEETENKAQTLLNSMEKVSLV